MSKGCGFVQTPSKYGTFHVLQRRGRQNDDERKEGMKKERPDDQEKQHLNGL
jgi:hypothetical protein